MKIVHISDLHYPKTGKTQLLVKAILGHYEAEKDKPVIVCSGDILDSSSRKKHFQEVKLILSEFKKQDYIFLTCPGNHDIKYEGIGPIINGSIRFNNYFSSLLPSGMNYYGDEDNNLIDFPIVHVKGNHFFIGLNSLAAEKTIGATGELGEEQIRDLKIILDEIRSDNVKPIITVYLHHHPLDFDYRPELMKLRDKEEFLDAIKDINILLFGHLHFNERLVKSENDLKIEVINLGANCVFGSKLEWAEIESDDFSIKRIRY